MIKLDNKILDIDKIVAASNIVFFQEERCYPQIIRNVIELRFEFLLTCKRLKEYYFTDVMSNARIFIDRDHPIYLNVTEDEFVKIGVESLQKHKNTIIKKGTHLLREIDDRFLDKELLAEKSRQQKRALESEIKHIEHVIKVNNERISEARSKIDNLPKH